jgi:hypothetical protein
MHWPLMTAYARSFMHEPKKKQKKTIRSVRMRAPPTFQTTKTARQKTYMNISPPACRRRTHRWMGNEHDSGHRLCATTTHAQPSVCSSCAQPQQHTTRSARRWVCPHGFRRDHAHLLSGKSRTYRWNEQPWREALAAASLAVRPQSVSLVQQGETSQKVRVAILKKVTKSNIFTFDRGRRETLVTSAESRAHRNKKSVFLFV